MNEHPGNARPIDSKQTVERQTVQLTDQANTQSAYLNSNTNQVNRSNFTLAKQETSPPPSRHSNYADYPLRARVEVGSQIMHETVGSSVLKEIGAANYGAEVTGAFNQDDSPTRKSPVRQLQQPHVERITLKQKEFVMKKQDERTNQQINLSNDQEALNIMKKRRSPVPKKKTNPTVQQNQHVDLQLVLRSNSQQQLMLDGQQIAYEVPVSIQPPQTSGGGMTLVNSPESKSKGLLLGNSAVLNSSGDKRNQKHHDKYYTYENNPTDPKSQESEVRVVKSTIGNDSSDQDKLQSRHYQDYLLSNEPSRKTLRERDSAEKPRSSSINYSNRKVSQVSNLINNRILQHDFQIEEVKEKHLQRVTQALEPYLKEKNTMETVLNTEQQMKRRLLPHSYESQRKQMRTISPSVLKRQAGGVAVHSIVPPSEKPPPELQSKIDEEIRQRLKLNQVGRIVPPKATVQVPKDLILMKIAQGQVDLHREQFSTMRSLDASRDNNKSSNQKTNEKQNSNPRNLSLPPLNSPFVVAGPKTTRDFHGAIELNQNSLQESVNDSRHIKFKPFVSLFKNNKSTEADSFDPLFQDSTDNTSGGPSIGFHITDLLQQSSSRGVDNMKAAIDYYKRSVKTQNEYQMQKEVIIKNYRLRVIDAGKDLTEKDRMLMKVNKGTTIHVANSLVKPEIFRFSTRVSNAIVEVFSDLRDLPNSETGQRVVSSKNFESLTFQDQLENEQKIFEDQSMRDLVYNPSNDKQKVSQVIEQQHGFLEKLRHDSSQTNISNRQLHSQQTVDPKVRQTPFTNPPATGLRNHLQSVAHSRGVSSGIYYEQEELQAVMQSEYLFLQWLYTQIEQKEPEETIQGLENRYILTNGQPAALTKKEITDRMANKRSAAQKLDLKHLPPLEDMTAQSQYKDRPYMQLMRSIVVQDVRRQIQEFLEETVKFKDASPSLKSHQSSLVQMIDYSTAIKAIMFVREQFTTLDPNLLHDTHLSNDLFIEKHHTDDLVKQLNSLKSGKKVTGKTDFIFSFDGRQQIKSIDVEIQSFNQQTGYFLVKNEAMNIQTMRPRSQIQLDTDHPDFKKHVRQLIIQNKAETCQYLRVLRLITAELLPRFSNHTMPPSIRQAIINNLTVDLTTYKKELVEKVLIQVESLYVFALMKATLSSQRDDPFIKNMMINFKVAYDSPAIKIEPQPSKEKKDLHPGIYAFKLEATRNELQESSLSLSNKKYMALPRLLYDISWRSIEDKQMFIIPIPVPFLLNFGGVTYISQTVKQINERYNTYPLSHSDWIQAQKVVSEQFNIIMRTKWSEVIASEVWSYIKDDFDFKNEQHFYEHQIDPNLFRILQQIRSYQTNILYDVFGKGLRQYLRFLLGFAMRDQEIKYSKIVNTIRGTDKMRLINEDPNWMPAEGEDFNDLELIPLQLKPLAKLRAEIQITGKTRNRKYKVITVPDLDVMQKDFFSVIRNLLDSTRNLKRVDRIIFPYLTLTQDTIPQPDIKTNQKMTYILKIIDKLLDTCTGGSRKKVVNLSSFLSIFDKKVDGLILELKKKTFDMQNEGGEEQDENAEKPLTVIKEEDQKAKQEQEKQQKQQNDSKLEGGEAGEDGEDDEDDDEAGAQAGNNLAYKSVEIDQMLLRDELMAVRKHKESVMDNISKAYDFGMLIMDCTPFSDVVLEHCALLEKEIVNYLQSEFQEKMRSVNFEIQQLSGRLNESVSSIDDVVALLNYIDSIKRQDNKIEEIADYIEIMTKQMSYIDSLRVILPEEMKIAFLHMRNWPRTFDSWVKKRKAELLLQKDELINQMKKQTEEVFAEVEEFKRLIDELMRRGLRKVNVEERQERKELIQKVFGSLQLKEGEVVVPADIPQMMTFSWLSQETGWLKQKFDPDTIMDVFVQVSQMKDKFDEIDKITVTINKRQSLLGIEKTEFKALKEVQDDLRPLYDLWTVAKNYKDKVFVWMEGPIDNVDANQLESQIDEWLIEMKRIQKSNLAQTRLKQAELLQFIFETLSYLKKYMPLIKATRTKGLTMRHWRQINVALSITIEPTTACFLHLIGMKLYLDEPLLVIRGISDIAAKEYAVQVSMESLEDEVLNVVFEFENGPSAEVKIVKQFEELLFKFEEFQVRVQLLKMNPYIKNFFEKLIEIEKMIKQTLELLNEFERLQKSWLYLQSIFSQNVLSDNLAFEIKLWQGIDQFYVSNIKSFIDYPQVWRITGRDGFLTQLRKINQETDQCREGLIRFLETKRQSYPRLYFLANEELLQIFGKQDEIIVSIAAGIEKVFLSNLFLGIDRLKVTGKSNQITAMISKEKEEVELWFAVSTSAALDLWLKKFEDSMQRTIKHQLIMAYQDMDRDIPPVPEDLKELKKYKLSTKFQVRRVDPHVLQNWVKRWPSQALYLSLQVWFTQKMQQVFAGAAEKSKRVADSKRHIYNQNVDSDSDASSSDEYKSIDQDDQYENEPEESDHGAPKHGRFAAPEVEAPSSQEVLQQSSMEQINSNEGGESVERTDEPHQSSQLSVIEGDPDNPETNTKKKQPAKPQSRLSLHDRAMRRFDRFQIVEVLHPTRVMQEVKNGIVQKIEIMLQTLHEKIDQPTRANNVALITACVYQRDQVQHMQDLQVYKASDFEWEISFKFEMDGIPKVFRQISNAQFERGPQEWESRLELSELELRLEVFNFAKNYGYEYLGSCQRLVITPLTLKAQRSMLMALQFQFGGAIEGPFGTGKTETAKDLSRTLGRPCQIFNASEEFDLVEVTRLFKGVAGSGCWVLIDEFNRMSTKSMNLITVIIQQIQTALRQQLRYVVFNDAKLILNEETAIFISLNPGYAGRQTLPIALKTLFRPICMVVPNSQMICEILLASCGFYFANQLSKKLSHVQQQANIRMRKFSHVKQDFGLRANRSIIQIAERLRRQLQYLQYSELPDLLNESSMQRINWSDTKLINDVITELNGTSSDINSNQQQNKSPFSNDKTAQQIMLAVKSASSGDFQNQLSSQTSKPSIHDTEYDMNFEGQFFDIAFNYGKSRKERQIEALHAMIGLTSTNTSEEDIEELIIIKAMKDYNQSKFGEKEQQEIQSIIYDVFPSALPKLNNNTVNNSASLDVATARNNYGELKELVLQQMHKEKLDYNPTLESKCYQLFEITQVKLGCIIMGEQQSAKSTLIQTLEGALNLASQNELKLRIAQLRKERLKESVIQSLNVSHLLPSDVVKYWRQYYKNKEKEKKADLNQPLSPLQASLGKFMNTKLASTFNSQKTVSNETEESAFKQQKKKLTEKQKMAIWTDLYVKTKLERMEIFALEQQLVIKGVKTVRINPKALSKRELIGEINAESEIWEEGLLSQALRRFASDETSLKKWIHLDGPMDYEWAENLNSILDDNKKIDLPNGDTIKMSNNMCLLFETDSLQNLTPATISRCGLIYMNKQTSLNPKQIFNQYLQKLSPNLGEYLKDIEGQCNWLIPTCFEVFNEEKQRGTLLFNQLDENWLIQSFIKLLDSFLSNYWIDHIKNNVSDFEDAPQQAALKKWLDAYGRRKAPLDVASQLQEDTIKLDPDVLQAEFKSLRLESAANDLVNTEERIAINDFLSNENRVENSLKFLVMWLEAFVLTSIMGIFGPVLTGQARNRLAAKLKVRILEQKSDFQTYQKIKKRAQQQAEEQRKASMKLLNKGVAASLSNIMQNARSLPLTKLGSESSLNGQTGKLSQGANDTTKFQFLQGSNPLFSPKSLPEGQTAQGFSTEFVPTKEETLKPLFITEFPFENDQGLGFFDFYFNMETNQWTKFDDTVFQSRMYLKYQESHSSYKNIQNITVPTMQQIKLFYSIECLLVMQRPILVCGEGASGKSTFVKDLIFNQVNVFTKQLLADHMTCSTYSTAFTLKDHFERSLETQKTTEQIEYLGDSDTEIPMKSLKSKSEDASRPVTAQTNLDGLFKKLLEWDQEPIKMRPEGPNTHVLFYIEDLHMAQYDKFDDNTTGETIRDLIQYSEWFSSKKQSMRRIEDVNFVTCVNTKSQNRKKISSRFLRHFNVIGIELLDQTSAFTIVNRLLEMHTLSWQSSMQDSVPSLSKAVIDLYFRCQEKLRASPMKVQYMFNQRELFKMLTSICKVENNYISSVDRICKLFYHEAVRQFADRILMKHDLVWFHETLKNVCAKNLYGIEEKPKKLQKQSEDESVSSQEDTWFANFPIKDVDKLWFSVINEEVEGYYQEIREVSSVTILVETWVEKYNEQKEKKQLNLVFYDELVRHLLKIMRAINLNGGHLIIVGLRGYAINQKVKLATFISNQIPYCLEMHSEFGVNEWLRDLRTKILQTGQDDKQICYIIDEYRITDPLWFNDIERIITCNQFTHVLSKFDIQGLLAAIKVQNRRGDREQKSTIKAGLQIEGVENNTIQKTDLKKINATTIIKENARLIFEEPTQANQCYLDLQKRIRKNLHFVVHFTPTGKHFREKIQRYSQLIINSSVMWIQNLSAEDLMQIGKQVFLKQMESEQQELLVQDQERDPRYDELKMDTEREKNLRVLKAFIQIYLQAIKFAKIYQQEHNHTLYFTPKFYLRVMTAYRRLLKERQKNVLAIQGRYKVGLNKIRDTINEITTYYKELEKKTPVLQKQQKHLVSIIVDIEEEYERITQQREFEVEQEHLAKEETQKALIIFETCQNALDKIAPCLNDAINSMQQLSKYHLVEIKSMSHPPKLVKLVMKAVCVLLDVEPQPKRKPNGKIKLSHWTAATSNLVLGDPNLPQVLEQFDRNKLTDEKMSRVEDIISASDYTLENAKKSCLAIEGLYIWVKAIRDYFYIFKELEPRRDALILAEKQYQDKLNFQNQKRTSITELEGRLEDLKVHQAEKTKLVEELKLEIQDQMVRKRRADALLRGLSSEKQKWIVCSRMLESKYSTVSGDVVLAAGIVTFGGGFIFNYRKQLVEKWNITALEPNGLPCSENFLIQELFGDNFQVREWHSNGLPGDKVSTDNALIMEKSKQYCLCIDPQQQALNWLKQQYASTGLTVTRMGDINFKKTLEVAIDLGKVVLVENLPERVDVNIESLVKQQISKYQDMRMIKFCRKQLKIEKTFKLILVSNLPKPNYDVNFTNHVTIVNFYVSLEGLSQNLLHLVVANERQDLEESFNESMEATYTNVKILKEVENQVLKCLEGQHVHQILSDEYLIEKLRESRETAEIIAARLRKINQVNTFLEKARVAYTTVAFRAATLYFAISDLSQMNCMYKFSLAWFLNQFKQSLAKANHLKSKKGDIRDNKIKIGSDEFLLLDPKLSVEERLDLLKQTLTQEIIRKITLSVFQEDRQTITYFLSLRVLQAEQLAEDELIAFALSGSKMVTDPSGDWKAKNTISWLSSNMWSDLQYLAKLKPFNQQNLLEHILKNQNQWQKLHEMQEICYDDLPNKTLLNLDSYNVVDIRDAMSKLDKQLLTSSQNNTNIRKSKTNVKASQQSVRKSTTKGGNLTEEQILADESIWAISESDEDESEYNRKDRNPDFHSSPELLQEEEKQMARFMVEKAPGSVRDTQDFAQLQSMTKKERKTYALRQQVLRCMIELSILKCLRPDLIPTCLHSLVSTIYDFEYANFEGNILAKFIDPAGTLDLRRLKAKYSDQKSENNGALEMPSKKKIENNIQLLIGEAYNESTCMIPVLFLISHSVNVLAELTTFCAKISQTQRLNTIVCQKEETKKLDELMRRCIQNGEWLLIENLNIEESWYALIETYITQFSADLNNSKFRLFLTIPQTETCPDFILQSCIKIALQQPDNIKKKIERHFQHLKDGIFRRSTENGNLHKNIYFGLSYLHAILDGRGAYGTIGWNVPHEFDANDFEISESVLASYIKKEIPQPEHVIRVLKYIFSKINFAGKVCRLEDLRKVQAHIEDLFNEEISLANESPFDPDHSHYGIPTKEADYMYYINMQIPQIDSYKILGFEQNIDRVKQSKYSKWLMSNLKSLNSQSIQEIGYGNVQTDIDNQLKKFALERFGSTQIKHSSNLGDVLVQNFVKLQTLLKTSSLDSQITMDQDRYDERIDGSMLPQRDLTDKEILGIAQNIIRLFNGFLNLPYSVSKCSEKEPVKQIILNEIKAYQSIRNVIVQTVKDLVLYLEGDVPTPIQTEELWHKVQNNIIPKSWIQCGYLTAHTSLAHYICEFVKKIQYWQDVIQQLVDSQNEIPRYFDISAFLDGGQLLLSFIQQRSRLENMQTRHMKNSFVITKFHEPWQCQEDQELQKRLKQNTHLFMIYGLWIEGAEWDIERQLLVEPSSTNVHQRFPAIEVSPAQDHEFKDRFEENEDDFYSFDNPPLTASELVEARKIKRAKLELQNAVRGVAVISKQSKKKEKGPEDQERKAKITEANASKLLGSMGNILSVGMMTVAEHRPDPKLRYYYYKCPVFETTNRLRLGGMAQDNKAVFYINLRTLEKPNKWVKRSVALLLEPGVIN